MADISKIKPSNGTVYNIKDTTARDGLTNRPTSFVGTRSEWNALPVATQVKYSLVNLIGEGVYKNNGTGLDNIADVGGGGASNNFQGTIEEWNALTTEEKKAYDHASIPDSIDGGVNFPASKVIMTGGENVEDAIDELTDIVGKVNSVNLSSAVSVPKSTMTTILSLNLTAGTYLITGSYLGFSLEASYFKGMMLMIGDSSYIVVDRRSDATSGGGTITGVVVVPENSTYAIKFKLMHTYTSSLNVSNAYLNSIKIA